MRGVAPGQAGGNIQVQVDRQVGPQSPRGKLRDSAQHIQVQAVPVALVGDGRVSITVAQHDVAIGQVRQDKFPDQLGAGCRVEQHFRRGKHLHVGDGMERLVEPVR